MAERGVDDDNPFSFKKFVSTKDKIPLRDVNDVTFEDDNEVKSSEGDGDGVSDDIFGLGLGLGPAKPEKGFASREMAPSSTTSSSGAQKGSVKKNKQKENPFSFKKFISSSSTVSKKGDNSTTTFSETTDAELSYPVIEPQTNGRVKDHVLGLSANGTEKMVEPDSFHSETTNKEAFSPLDLPFPEAKQDVNRDFKHFNFHDGEELNDIDSPLSMKDCAASGPLALPDFLTDTAMLNARQTMAGPVHDKTEESYEDLLDKVSLLQEENDTLRSDLNRERVKNQEKSHRLSQLKVDLERQKAKEAEDMAVLERAVLQVEENLVTTTKRAVQAEATVAKLKLEVRSLQKQIKIVTAESEVYRSGDRGLSDIRERTKYTSDELKAASIIAEKNVKELMVGVDKLKLLSQVLSSLEKVTEVIPEVLQEDETKPS